MATTVAHGLMGIAVYCAARECLPTLKQLPLSPKMLILAAIAANIPDFDIVVSFLLLGDHKLLHGVGSHSFLFATLVAVMVWSVGRTKQWPNSFSLLAFLVVLSHVVVDWLTGPNLGLHSSHGSAFLWPLIETPISAPITVFKGVNHSALLPDALYIALWELFIIGPIVIFISLFIKKLNH